MQSEKKLSKLGLSFPILLLLAALPLPRAIAHDLNLVNEGDILNSVLIFIPPIIWLAVVFWKKVPRPFLTLIIVGLIYGILLGIVHQIFWTSFWNGNEPHLGGNLAGQFSPFIESLIMRTATFFSSVVIGVITGGFVGTIAIGALYMLPLQNKS